MSKASWPRGLVARCALVLGLVGHSATRPLLAQTAAEANPRHTSDFIRYGKWGAAGLFAGLTVLGAIEHGNASSAYDGLQAYCRAGNPCVIGSDGRYANPVAEARYQDVVRGDRAARVFLVSGQVALAGATTLFVLELLKERGTRNIPFQGFTVMPGRAGSTKVGWSLHF